MQLLRNFTDPRGPSTYEYGVPSCLHATINFPSLLAQKAVGNWVAGWAPHLAPKVCKITAFMAVMMGLRLLFYMLLG